MPRQSFDKGLWPDDHVAAYGSEHVAREHALALNFVAGRESFSVRQSQIDNRYWEVYCSHTYVGFKPAS
jgi:hypothetical protein